MKTLALIAALALTVHAQSLIAADGVEWRFVATVKDGESKLDLYAKMPLEGNKRQPRLTVKAWGGPESVVNLDCKRQAVRANDEKWVKAPPKSFGKVLLDFACKK